MYVLLRGNFNEGFVLYGPFVDFDAAAEFDETQEFQRDAFVSWIATLETPEGIDCEGTHVIVSGALGDGFKFTGPFADIAAGVAYAENNVSDCSVWGVALLHRLVRKLEKEA